MKRRTKGKRTHRTCDCCGREIFSYQDTVYGDRRTYHYECWKPPHYQRYPLVIPWNGALSYAIRIDVISAIA